MGLHAILAEYQDDPLICELKPYCVTVRVESLYINSFEIIAFYAMRSAIGHEYEKQRRRIQTITPKYLSNIECGAKVPKLETFIEIANALEVDANTLLVDVLTVSSAIISTEISEQLAALSPHERKRIKRIFDVMIEDAVKQPK